MCKNTYHYVLGICEISRSIQTGSPKLDSCAQIDRLLILENLLCGSVDIVYAASTDSDSWIEREVFMFAPLECFVPNVLVLKPAN